MASDRTTCQSSRTRMETNKGARMGHIRASSTPCEHHNGTGNCSGNGYGNTPVRDTPQALCPPSAVAATWSNGVAGFPIAGAMASSDAPPATPKLMTIG